MKGCGASGFSLDYGSGFNIGVLIIRIGFGGILYYNYNKEHQNPILTIKAPTLGVQKFLAWLHSVPQQEA